MAASRTKAVGLIKIVRIGLGRTGIFLCGHHRRIHIHLFPEGVDGLLELFFLFLQKKIRLVKDPDVSCHLPGARGLGGHTQSAPGIPRDPNGHKRRHAQDSHPFFHPHRNHPPIISAANTGKNTPKNSPASFLLSTGSRPQIFPVWPFMAK